MKGGKLLLLIIRSIIKMMKRLPVILLLCSLLTAQLASGQSYKPITVSQPNIEEDAPVFFEDKLVFVSNRPHTSATSLTDQDGRYFIHRYSAKFEGDWKFGQVEDFAPELATELNDGPVAFTPDEQTICFTRMYVEEGDGGRNSNDNSGLYFADLDYTLNQWTDIRPFEFNDPEVNFYSPNFSRDGKRLFFAANYPDSRGGLDLYVSEKVNGAWTKPVNLGDEVNSAQNEFYPYSHISGKLYFCSGGHDNGGGIDIFVTVEEQGKWLKPHKLGVPYNSASDDYSLYISDDYKKSYFVSKRRGGSKDIYYYGNDMPEFDQPKEQKKNNFCYLLQENTADTADPAMFDYMWIINDTLTLHGRSVEYCFPGQGFYYIRFNVFNKMLDTLYTDQGNQQLNLTNKVQAYISCPDTAVAGVEIIFDASETYIPDYDIGKYYWDFGDGEWAEGEKVRHTYLFPGSYKVVLGAVEKVRNKKDVPFKKANFKHIVIIPPN